MLADDLEQLYRRQECLLDLLKKYEHHQHGTLCSIYCQQKWYVKHLAKIERRIDALEAILAPAGTTEEKISKVNAALRVFYHPFEEFWTTFMARATFDESVKNDLLRYREDLYGLRHEEREKEDSFDQFPRV